MDVLGKLSIAKFPILFAFIVLTHFQLKLPKGFFQCEKHKLLARIFLKLFNFAHWVMLWAIRFGPFAHLDIESTLC